MRVLMFGWEFPPHISGGLGTACEGLTRALARQGTTLCFVVPRLTAKASAAHLRLVSASGTRVSGPLQRRFDQTVRAIWESRLTVRPLDSFLRPYMRPGSEPGWLEPGRWAFDSGSEPAGGQAPESILVLSGDYGADLMGEVFRYSQAAAALATRERFDLIHAHDWMAFPAGLMARDISGKPLIVHVHSLEYDRSGRHGNRDVERIEKAGLEGADRIIAVSHYTKALIQSQYGIPADKIDVVHNAVSRRDAPSVYRAVRHPAEKRVLFMGRVTFQKGPDYFVEAAARVLRARPDVRFVMAGSGDMLPRMVHRAAQLRIGHRFHFTGFLKGPDVERILAQSDLYVMPSVSEPFGIAPLEAMLYDVPVLLSRQSGVAEVLRHALRVDFWDVRGMADKILAVLNHPPLAATVVRHCREEMKSIRWETAAEAVRHIYRLAQPGGH